MRVIRAAIIRPREYDAGSRKRSGIVLFSIIVQVPTIKPLVERIAPGTELTKPPR
jgi:hypothetical protein